MNQKWCVKYICESKNSEKTDDIFYHYCTLYAIKNLDGFTFGVGQLAQ
jgi:hypothetical protein